MEIVNRRVQSVFFFFCLDHLGEDFTAFQVTKKEVAE